MAQFETLFFLVLLGVASLYFLMHLHMAGSGHPVNPEQTYQIAELNSTLNELNAALKAMIKEAHHRTQRQEREQAAGEHLRGAQPSAARAAPPVTLQLPSAAVDRPKKGHKSTKGKRAVIFTMDSISSYEENSKRGGAAGELLVRYCLQQAMQELGVAVHVVQSDREFNRINGNSYDYIFLDPWTWAGPGWVPKPNIKNHLHKLFILDFFGTKELKKSLRIPLTRVLTPFGTPWNTFLGFYLSESTIAADSGRIKQGVIWGKDPRHFKGQQDILARIAAEVPLVSTSQEKVFSTSGISWLGHQTPQSWNKLLAESKFVLGLGDPLLGPSAIDAVAAGCMYINPIYDEPVRDIYKTQHDFASDVIGFPHVCSVKLSDHEAIMKCINYALSHDIQPFVPDILHQKEYVKRVESILLSV